MAREEGALTPSQQGRRLFLAAMGGALLPALASAQDPEDDIRRYIENFPKEIPGIARITIPVMPEHPVGLVGIFEQIHWEPGIEQKNKWEVNDCQDELYRAQDYLVGLPGAAMKTMRSEAVCTGREKNQMEIAMRLLSAHIRKVAGEILEPSERRADGFYDPKNALWQRLIRGKVDGYTALARYGAAEVLHYERKLRVLPAEASEAHNAAATVKPEHPDYRKIVYHDREKAAIAQTVRSVDWMTFGCSHRWDDDVRLHNEGNPDDQRVLMLLTPMTVGRLYKYPDAMDGAVYENEAA